MTILITGGAGFIGSNFAENWLKNNKGNLVNLDKLTYAGNLSNLLALKNNPSYIFIKGDICDAQLIGELLEKHKPDKIVNFAAESHVDRSIHGPEEFIQTNIIGTFRLLEATKSYWSSMNEDEKKKFRFLHVSTDEVYGTLSNNDPAFSEENPYKPNSPYSASKASSDHLVRAYHHTYGMPVLTTNCSNNYGPYQFPEKLIPLIIHNALKLKSLPIYGDGLQIRDWLYVTDHCNAIETVLSRGRIGEVYNIGGLNEKTNIEIVNILCNILDELSPVDKKSDIKNYSDLISYVKDRPGHDRRYAVNATKIETELGWTPAETFESGIRKTVHWYLNNSQWVQEIVSGDYKNWTEVHYK